MWMYDQLAYMSREMYNELMKITNHPVPNVFDRLFAALKNALSAKSAAKADRCTATSQQHLTTE